MTGSFIHSRFIHSLKKKQVGMDGDVLNYIPHPYRSRGTRNDWEWMGTIGNDWNFSPPFAAFWPQGP